MDLFPYELRKNQTAIMQTIKKILSENKNLIFESGTGSGKTICAVAAALEFSIEHDKKIIYATRTNSQQRQVIVELRQIRNKYDNLKNRIFGVGVQGRSNMCIFAKNNSDLSNGTSEELARLCKAEKSKIKENIEKSDGCIYYKFFLNREKVEKTINWFQSNLPTAEEFISYCEKHEICPYEVNKEIIKKSNLVVVPYIYVFDLMIRNMLFDCLSVDEKDMILIIDEAHNLPDYIRDLYSSQLSIFMLKNCVNEAENYGDPSILGGRSTVKSFCNILVDILYDLRDTYIYGILENGIRKIPHKNEDAFLPSHEFETEILTRLNITSNSLHNIINDLIAYGEAVQDYKQKDGKLPRSYIHKLGVFLDFWVNLELSQYAKLVVDGFSGKNPRIEAYCLDPSVHSDIIRFFHSSIHMSGTLEPLEEYRDSMGLFENTELVSFPSSFPKSNRRIFYLKDVTTKYQDITQDRNVIDRINKYITDICNNFQNNTMVFFPSFGIMSYFKKNGLSNKINRCVYFEEQELSQSDLMNLILEFKQCANNGEDGAALFSVMGGRISEGMDFPAKQLELALVVGIPYPKPSARQRGLQRYYDMKFRKGWYYTVEAPTARKLLQSIGRLIRDENDRGVAVILDRRAPRFKKYIRDLKISDNILKDIGDFIDH